LAAPPHRTISEEFYYANGLRETHLASVGVISQTYIVTLSLNKDQYETTRAFGDFDLTGDFNLKHRLG